MSSILFSMAALAVRREAERQGSNGMPHRERDLECLAEALCICAKHEQPCYQWITLKNEYKGLIETLRGDVRNAIDMLEGNC